MEHFTGMMANRRCATARNNADEVCYPKYVLPAAMFEQ